ncbi:MAG TPA: PEP-CTERM sorting domain-containing protein [Chthoniobacteraceae bacterium]|jgi:hypothetical protein
MHSSKRIIAAAIGISLLHCAPSLMAASYVGTAYEGFDYATGQILSANYANYNGGTGFTSAWGTNITGNNTYRSIEAGSLDFNLNAAPVSSGNKLLLDATVAGQSPNNATGSTAIGRPIGQTVDSGVFYFSYLTAKTLDSNRTLNLSFFGTNERFAIGQIAPGVPVSGPGGEGSGAFVASVSNTQNPVSGGGTGVNGIYTATSPILYGLNTTHLVVGRLDFNVGGGVTDTLTLYIDPANLTNEAAVSPYLQITSNDFGALSAFRLFAGGSSGTSPAVVYPAVAGTFDEIRLGTSYTEVTGVPEPSAATLLIGAVGLICSARRKRRTA